MISEKLKRRLSKDRRRVKIDVSIPEDVVEDLSLAARAQGLERVESVIRLYISEGLIRDFGRSRVEKAPWSDVEKALLALGWTSDDVRDEFSRRFDESLINSTTEFESPVGKLIHDEGGDEPSELEELVSWVSSEEACEEVRKAVDKASEDMLG